MAGTLASRLVAGTGLPQLGYEPEKDLNGERGYSGPRAQGPLAIRP